ncbi:hypothetical protein RAF34_03110 [Klebsiella pneumoniae]|uniref:hypothetical protein n=1 Tax=Klebsiella pneumoniae TaxID=573 RepID=UPI000E2C5BCD|nr:hypothetical protein [Klebsiella pneumoniae]SWN59331.1 RelE family toxin-antitoxin system [Klebsiella pneumoniae]HBR4027321.1 hypothetical protein [Klebsiella pneumoniae]
MTDITELAQRMKAAAEKLGGAQWQTRKGFSGIEVIVKGSLEKRTGCVSFQPVAADIADTKTARAIALFSPANALALVGALEKAQTKADVYDMLRDDYGLREKGVGLADFVDWQAKRIAELESRTVKLPKLKMLEDYLAEVAIEERKQILVGVKLEFHRACAAAGIKVEAE